MRRLIYLTIILTFTSCDNPKRQIVKDSAQKENTVKGYETTFNQTELIEILNFKKTNDYPSSETDTTMCRTWTLSAKDIEKIIKESEIISGPDWHHLFEHLPCSITGQLKQTTKTFDFQINGGSWLTIRDNDTSLYFGYFKQNGDELFISTPMDIENEE